MLIRTPRIVTPALESLALRIVSGAKARFIEIRPRPDGTVNECFGNVRLQVDELGGRVQHGWVLWEWPGVLIEAEFHSVWVAPDGSWVDVTPRSDAEHTVLFVADPKRVFDGRAIDSVRVALRDDPRIHEYIGLAKRRFEILSRGKRTSIPATVAIPREEIAPVSLRMEALYTELAEPSAGRNDPCPCGSGKKYKKCHGR